MQLISTLQEASSHQIDELKRVMQKDPRVKQIFQKHLDLEDIRNPAEFLNTVKFFLLNNRNVIDFVEGRNYVKALDKNALKKLRELKPATMTQRDVDNLLQFASDVFREFKHVENSGMSPELRKEILEWVNKNGRYFDLSRHAQRELLSLPNVRPTRPILVYRGLLFSGSDLKERKRYDGSLEIGKGLKFLRSIREGSRVVDLEWDRASSWSTSKEVAMRFAQFSSASSNFEATMNWLSRKGKIDGDLGFVISTLAQPEDILLDVSRFVTSAHMQHGGEGEIILAPGTYTCRVTTKLTKEKGEVDPIKSAEIDESINNAVAAVKEFARTWEVEDFSDLKTEGWSTIDVERMLRSGSTEAFSKLARKGTKEAALKALSQLKEFYHEHLENLSEEQLQTIQADKRIGKIAEWIVELRKWMNEESRHQAHRTVDNPKGRVAHKKMSVEQLRDTNYSPTHTKLKDATTGARFTDYATGNAVNSLLTGLGDTPEKDIHRRGRKDQEAVMDRLLKKFYDKLNVEQPADRAEAINKMLMAVLGAERTAGVISKVLDLRDDLNEAIGKSVD